MIDFIFPRKCILCRSNIKSSNYPAWICKNCLKSIEYIEKIYCNRCFSPYEDKCICQNLYYNIKEIKSCFLYNGQGKELIHKWKYSKIFFIKDFFEKVFIKHYPYKNLTFDIILFVPIFFIKKIFRGFNQSEILAHSLAKHYSLNLNYNLKRVKFRKSQVKCKNYSERQGNIKNVFKFRDENRYKNILLIDDIITSGSTVSEIAKFFPESDIYVYTLSIAR